MNRSKWMNGSFLLGASVTELIMNIATSEPGWGLAASVVGICCSLLMIREGR